MRTRKEDKEMLPLRRAWVEVDLGAIRHNLRHIKKRVGKGVKVLAAVKADAYGHGMIPVARALVKEGVDWLGVATPGEGARLREAGLGLPILIFGSVPLDEMRGILEYGLTPTLYTEEMITSLNDEAKRIGGKAKLHIKVDTGMGRIGAWYEETAQLLKKVYKLPNIEIEGIYTHFPSADEGDKTFTYYQIRLFSQLIRELDSNNIDIPYKHAANSAAVLGIEESYFNLVRPGLLLYGVLPSENVEPPFDIRPALFLKARISDLRSVPAGRSISYGRDYLTTHRTSIATLSIGYADGYSHLLSNRAQVLVKGARAPVVGRVCMDQTMVDVGRIKGVAVGDEVVLIGTQGKGCVKAEELAKLCGTIPYQILCWISHSLPRLYKEA